MKVFEFGIKNTYLLRLEHDRDLIEQLQKFLEENDVRAGYVSGIGALSHAEIGYYDQDEKKYVREEIDEKCEIASLMGNVSLKDGKPFPHLHTVLWDGRGNVYAGHLFKARVFAAELFVAVLEGTIPERVHDPVTGLALWK